MKRLTTLLVALIGLAASAALWAPEARAIAAFTRQYRVECSTCHFPYPRRTEFGEAFRKNSFVWPGRPPEEKAPEGKESSWLSAIPEFVPVSASLRTDLSFDEEAEKDQFNPSVDALLHVGGTLRDRVGYFAHDILTSGTEMFGSFRHLFETPVNVKYGKLIPQTTLWKPNQGITDAPLATLGFQVTGGGDPLGKPRDALELNAVLAKRFFVAAGVADRPSQDPMEYYAHASYKFGGTDFEGGEPELSLDEESVWDFLTVTVGVYAYRGTVDEEVSGHPYQTDFWRGGLEAEAQFKGFTVLASVAQGRDDDVDGTGTEVDSFVALAEVDYFWAPRYLVGLRYEHENVGNAAEGLTRRVIANLTWMPFESLAVRLEGKQVRTAEGDDHLDTTGLLRVEYHL